MKTENINEYLKARYYSMKEWALSYLGNACAHCGATEKLHFDHKNRREKAFNITRALRSKPKYTVEQELKKCQLLCPTCHNKKTSREKLFSGHNGSKMGTAKLDESQVYMIKEMLKQGQNKAEIAHFWGVTMENITHISNGKTWRHVF